MASMVTQQQISLQCSLGIDCLALRQVRFMSMPVLRQKVTSLMTEKEILTETPCLVLYC